MRNDADCVISVIYGRWMAAKNFVSQTVIPFKTRVQAAKLSRQKTRMSAESADIFEMNVDTDRIYCALPLFNRGQPIVF